MKANSNIYVAICFCFLQSIGICFCDVEQLESTEFNSFVTSNDLVLVLFKASGECPSCNKALEYLGRLPQPDLVQTEILKRYVIDDRLADKLGALDYPSLVYYRNGYPALYNVKLSSSDDLPELVEWLSQASDVATKDLFDDSFEHLTQASTGATTGDWFVLFYKPGCEDCMKILPSVECAAISVKYRMSFAKIDVDQNPKLTKRFNITTCPYGILFKKGKMYPYEPGKFDTNSLLAFTETWYKNVKSSPVPREPTSFDILTEAIAMYIKQQVEDPNKNLLLILGVPSVCLLVVVLLIFVLRKPQDTRRKHD
ncbi:thioredoxin domain-containing protein-like [Ruditapes philippinarum]|uniref:thioredoxin domain-containing protein-like n=1 Tax=Ruditapes philippinarum TaxID=129788 RepID=UPI00295A93E7|nr:thioredoxin domain-containing protein-like [Ruditapes philippinarum]